MAHEPANAPDRLAGWRATLALVGGVTIARFAALLWVCTIPLIEDEAFYWEWSLRPALSYYTKGPGIAWLIRSTTELFGTSEFGVRAAAPICGAIVALCVARMAAIAGGQRAGFLAAVCVLCAPMLQASSMLMTIDGPYAACWALAALAACSALLREGKAAWIAMGLALGVGFLFKYTIVALPISLVIFAIWRRADLRLAQQWRLWAALGLAAAALGTLPVVVWNIREGWPTIAHLLGHLGVRGGDMPVTQGSGGWRYSPLWTLVYVLGPIGMIGPAVIVGAFGAARAARGLGDPATLPLRRLLACACATLFAFYLVVSFITEPEGNWSLAAFITALALAGVELAAGLDRLRQRIAAWRELPEPRPWQGWFLRRPQSPALAAWWATLAIGIAAGVALPLADRLATLLPSVIPAARLSGIRAMAHDADAQIAKLSEDGAKPFLLAMHYGRAAQLRFYMQDRPLVYCSGRTLGHGRVTQYDFWSDTNLRDPSLIERPALVVGGTRESWTPFFDDVGEPFTLDGDLKKGRPAMVCRGYRGIPTEPAP